MGPLTAQTPKPMLPFAGAPLAAHALFFLKELGIQRAVLNLHYLGAQIERGLAGIRSVELRYSHEAKILGTAGGIRQALGLLESDLIVVVNPDVVLWPAEPLTVERLDGLRARADALLFVSKRNGAETGFRLLGNGALSFETDGPDYYIGCAVIKVSAFASLRAGEFGELGSLWRAMDQRGSLRGVRFEGDIVDMGSQDSYMQNRDRAVPARLAAAWATFLEELR